MQQKPIAPILIAGPTASGKSAAALALARQLDGVVINADSMQVYSGLRVLTARPSEQDEALAPHKLYGFVSPAEAYSVGRWLEDVAGEIEAARADGQTPILVGGTGLYFKALLEGLAPVPDVPAQVRDHWRSQAERLSGAELHAMLAARDPVMADRLRPQDPQRIVRALEVIDATGRSLSEWQAAPVQSVLDGQDARAVVVAPEREIIYARCEERFAAMLDGGALDEVAALMALELDSGLPAMRALGVAALMAHLCGEIGLEEAATRVKTETRRYAKRQLTWLRSNMITWKWFVEKDMVSLEPELFAFIDV
jgi:tRNA dimethylallyltransferase